jgi:hypothetical protein
MAKSPRSVIREHHFEKDLAEIIGDVEAADDFAAGAEWLLAQNPEIGFPIAEDSQFGFCRWPRLMARKSRSTTRSTIQPFG